ncbi:MAG TPA: phosphatase PAP2 family protein [Gemmataceae bacterium]|nr:phosphatase PAP2 family protein [Gemmataceae bacterium]
MKACALFHPRVGLALVVLAVLAFTWLANGVVGGRWAEWNEAMRQQVRAPASPELTGFAVAVTSLCNARELKLLVLGAVGFFVARRRHIDAAGLLAVIAGVVAMENVLKPLFAIARPVPFDPAFTAPGYSFPSGHALRAVGLFGYLAAMALAGGGRAWWRWVLTVVGVALAVGVCWSRVYLGVHFPTDVIAGALAAGAWVVVCLIARHSVMARLRKGSASPTATG